MCFKLHSIARDVKIVSYLLKTFSIRQTIPFHIHYLQLLLCREFGMFIWRVRHMERRVEMYFIYLRTASQYICKIWSERYEAVIIDIQDTYSIYKTACTKSFPKLHIAPSSRANVLESYYLAAYKHNPSNSNILRCLQALSSFCVWDSFTHFPFVRDNIALTLFSIWKTTFFQRLQGTIFFWSISILAPKKSISLYTELLTPVSFVHAFSIWKPSLFKMC